MRNRFETFSMRFKTGSFGLHAISRQFRLEPVSLNHRFLTFNQNNRSTYKRSESMFGRGAVREQIIFRVKMQMAICCPGYLNGQLILDFLQVGTTILKLHHLGKHLIIFWRLRMLPLLQISGLGNAGRYSQPNPSRFECKVRYLHHKSNGRA